MHTVIQEWRPSVWSAAAENFNEICKVRARLRAVLQITSAQQTRTNWLHPPPSKIKSNRRFNALAKEVQNMFDTKHKKRPTHYKNTMRPQQAIRSNTEHICTTMFIRSRIFKVPLLLEDDSLTRTASPCASFAPKRTSTLGKLEWSNNVNVCTQRGRFTPRTGAQQH